MASLFADETFSKSTIFEQENYKLWSLVIDCRNNTILYHIPSQYHVALDRLACYIWSTETKLNADNLIEWIIDIATERGLSLISIDVAEYLQLYLSGELSERYYSDEESILHSMMSLFPYIHGNEDIFKKCKCCPSYHNWYEISPPLPLRFKPRPKNRLSQFKHSKSALQPHPSSTSTVNKTTSRPPPSRPQSQRSQSRATDPITKLSSLTFADVKKNKRFLGLLMISIHQRYAVNGKQINHKLLEKYTENAALGEGISISDKNGFTATENAVLERAKLTDPTCPGRGDAFIINRQDVVDHFVKLAPLGFITNMVEHKVFKGRLKLSDDDEKTEQKSNENGNGVDHDNNHNHDDLLDNLPSSNMNLSHLLLDNDQSNEENEQDLKTENDDEVANEHSVMCASDINNDIDDQHAVHVDINDETEHEVNSNNFNDRSSSDLSPSAANLSNSLFSSPSKASNISGLAENVTTSSYSSPSTLIQNVRTSNPDPEDVHHCVRLLKKNKIKLFMHTAYGDDGFGFTPYDLGCCLLKAFVDQDQ